MPSNIAEFSFHKSKITFRFRNFPNKSDYNQSWFLVSYMHLFARCFLKNSHFGLSGTKKIAHYIISFITDLCGTFNAERKLNLRDLLPLCLERLQRHRRRGRVFLALLLNVGILLLWLESPIIFIGLSVYLCFLVVLATQMHRWY